MSKKLTFVQARRCILTVLCTSPFLLTLSYGRKDSSLALISKDSGEFVIVNGWVMLKQDIIEYAG